MNDKFGYYIDTYVGSVDPYKSPYYGNINITRKKEPISPHHDYSSTKENEKVLNKMPIKDIENFLRKKKLNNLLND